MNKPYELLKRFRLLVPNHSLLTVLRKKHPKEYIRRRLRTIKLLWEGQSPKEIIDMLDVRRTQIQEWMNIMVNEGVDKGLQYIARSMKIRRTGKLSEEQQMELISMVENESPQKYGYIQNTFTGKIVVELIQKRYGICVCDQVVYDMLKKHGYSYQKGHRDYKRADKAKQQEYCETLKKNWQPKNVEKK